MPDALEDHDISILRVLQERGKISGQDLADACNMSPSPCWRRVRRLEETGVIDRYVAVLDPKALGLNAIAYVYVSLIDHCEETTAKFDQMIQAESRVVECAAITGESDFVLKVAAKDPEDLEAFIMKRILGTGLVRSTKTNFVLRRTKSSTAWPLS